MTTITIEIWGFDMDVLFDYEAGDEFGRGEHVAVNTVLVGGVDITDMLSPQQTDRIEGVTLRAYLKQCEEINLDFAIERYEADRSFIEMGCRA